MLTVVTWKWKSKAGPIFGPEYVNRMRAMLERNLHIPHRMLCMTDDTHAIDRRVECVPLPTEFANTFRCRRRMWQYSKDRLPLFGPRFLSIDLDLVLTGDITPLIDRPEPIVMLRIGYANVLSGSFILCDTGALHGAYDRYRREPDAFAQATGLKNASDQAFINLHVKSTRTPVAEWKESDGFVVYFGVGYEQFAHHGVGPLRPHLPVGTKVVVLGSDDKLVMDAGTFPWVTEHWTA